MQPTNFLRSAWPQLDTFWVTNLSDGTWPAYERAVQHFLTCAPNAVKFCLPHGGESLPGQNGSKLSKTGGRLPLPSIILELNHDGGSMCILAEQTTPGSDEIVLLTAVRAPGGPWEINPTAVSVTNHPELCSYKLRLAKLPKPRSYYQQHAPDKAAAFAQGVAQTVLAFLEALECKNVTTDRLPKPKVRQSEGKSALPFDEYHTLFVDVATTHKEVSGGTKTSDRRQTREHLRRGTVCHNANGTRWWRQGTVVNAGVGGKITKSYVVTKPVQ